MPLLSTLGAGSARGFGRGLASGLIGLISKASDGSALNDPKAGDVVIACTGNLTTPLTIPSGYTNLLALTSSSIWGSQPNYKVSAVMSYRVLDGTETSGPGAFAHYRFASPISSVSVSQSNIQTGASAGSFGNGNSSALGTVVVVGRGAYNGGLGSFTSGVPSDVIAEAAVHTNSYAGGNFILYSGSGSYSAAAGGFAGASMFAQFNFF